MRNVDAALSGLLGIGAPKRPPAFCVCGGGLTLERLVPNDASPKTPWLAAPVLVNGPASLRWKSPVAGIALETMLEDKPWS